ncbi:nuclear transport factor 2 family protein [Nocardioides sp. Soil805]|uniref:nuclear transport factor 2 family protein n=1 Tax=Nocardioides sp. Soil805 TaxID=1736416 RepID=UPI000703801E|nr:nuclear transport factor 2 family protein [Nocardioides sp. Soil805]KRF36096.1 ketosteroid isomerase [Nocardioides sp. Soil805]
MSAQENIERTKRAYAAFSAADVDGASEAIDDDVEWIVAGDSAISGTYHGKEEVLGFWMTLAGKEFATRPQYFLGDDERVVVLTSVTVGGETSDQADVLTFRDGKVVKFQSAGDTAMQERVWGRK